MSALYSTYDLSSRVAVVTGASSGIGAATAWRLAELGMKLVLVARRGDKLKELAAAMVERFPSLTPPLVLTADLSLPESVDRMMADLASAGEGWTDVDLLVNNAGCALGVAPVHDLDTAQVTMMMQTNVMALILLTQKVTKGMVERASGHVVNIGSVAASDSYPGGTVYCATKAAVEMFTTCARMDLAGTPVRVTTLSPGLVGGTEFSNVRFGGDQSKVDAVYQDISPLTPEDVADQVVYVATRPRHVQVADLKTYACNQAHAKFVVQRVGPSLGGSGNP
jgi:NADP-dependent 3-hydroxy acid dehydrogenase YdfG